MAAAPTPEERTPSRRAVLRGLAGAGAAGAVGSLAGCANSGGREPSTTTGQGGAIIAIDEVPVGGVAAVTIDRRPAFIARPDTDTVRAFSAVCTHQHCTVVPAGDILLCPCHRSQFELLTGAVLRGPATEDLPPIDVHIAAGDVVAGADEPNTGLPGADEPNTGLPGADQSE